MSLFKLVPTASQTAKKAFRLPSHFLLPYPIPMERSLTLVKKYWPLVLVLALVLMFALGYASGLRFDRTGIVQVGTLVVEIPDGARVYLDESRVLHERDGVARATLRPGAHSVIVDIDGMQPWNELVELSSGSVSTLSPIEVPKEPVLEEVPQERLAEGWAARRGALLPSEATPLTLECQKIWVSGVRILAAPADESCAPAFLLCEDAARTKEGTCPATVVFSSSAPLRSVVAFPQRTDALAIAAGSQSFVIELDPRQPQFFAPLVKSMVTLAPWDEGTLLVEKAGILFTLPL